MRKGIKDPKVEEIKKRERIKSHGGHPKTKKYKKGEKEKKKKKREGATLLSFIPHLCFKVAPVLHREFSYHSCITMWGSIHYRTWLAYSKDEPPQKSSRSS